jgi:hypothetical protein
MSWRYVIGGGVDTLQQPLPIALSKGGVVRDTNL